MSHLTVQEFLTQQIDPEEELDDLEPAPSVKFDMTPDPLGSIALSLSSITTMLEHDRMGETEADRLRQAFDDLRAECDELFDLVSEIEVIIKPSTSKLAIQVREAIGRWRGVEPEPVEVVVEEPVGEPKPVPVSPPAKDAPVEEWRVYAVEMGVLENVSQLNRSQIRTLLGIPQA